MTKRNKAIWIKALRSGEYKQGHYVLHKADGSMCCLGVAIDVLYKGDWILGADESPLKKENYAMDGYAGTLSERVEKALGLDFHAVNKLVQLNDVSKASFEEIADWVEKNL